MRSPRAIREAATGPNVGALRYASDPATVLVWPDAPSLDPQPRLLHQALSVQIGVQQWRTPDPSGTSCWFSFCRLAFREMSGPMIVFA